MYRCVGVDQRSDLGEINFGRNSASTKVTILQFLGLSKARKLLDRSLPATSEQVTNNMQTLAAFTPTAVAPVARKGLRRIWPTALVIFGLGLTVDWTILLAYGLLKLIEIAF